MTADPRVGVGGFVAGPHRKWRAGNDCRLPVVSSGPPHPTPYLLALRAELKADKAGLPACEWSYWQPEILILAEKPTWGRTWGGAVD